MRGAAAVIIAIGVAALGGAGVGAAERARITTFTISPGEPLKPQPRGAVETSALPVPVVTPPPPPLPPLTAERLAGRWTERDPVYCEQATYVIDWTPDRMAILLDGRAIDGGPVRYTPDGTTLKVERLDGAGAVSGYWRLAAVDGDRVQWLESATGSGPGPIVIANPDKLLVRCAPTAAPPPGMMDRARRWWAGFVEHLWPGAPPPAPPRS